MNIVNITPRSKPIKIYSTGSNHFGSLCLLLVDISNIFPPPYPHWSAIALAIPGNVLLLTLLLSSAVFVFLNA